MIDSLISPPNLANSRIKPMDQALIKQDHTTTAIYVARALRDFGDGFTDLHHQDGNSEPLSDTCCSHDFGGWR